MGPVPLTISQPASKPALAYQRTCSLTPSPEIPPLLARMLAEQARTGLPPAYLPKDEREREAPRDSDDDGGAS
jgi:hypothetical protein